MAFGWMTAVKVIPWGDVLEAGPHILKGAKRLISAKKGKPDDEAITTASSSHDVLADLDNRIHQLQAKVVELNTEQKSSASLIQSLAEQHARVVEEIEVLRARTRVLVLACILSSVTLAALIVWLALN